MIRLLRLRAGLLAVLILAAVSCGQEERRQSLYEQLTDLRQQIDDLSGLPRANSYKPIIDDSRRQLERASDLILNSEYDQAETLLYQIDGSVRVASSRINGPPVPVMPAVRVTGDAVYEPTGGGNEQPYTANISPSRVKGLETTTNSAVIWRLHERITLHILPNSRVRILNFGSETELMALRLQKGGIRIASSGEQSVVNVLAGTFSAVTGSLAVAEFYVTDDGNPDYLSVFRGSVRWQSDSGQGVVDRDQALSWPAGELTTNALSLEPRIVKPEHGQTIAIPGQAGTIRFAWSAPDENQAYRFELSTEPDFLTTIGSQRVEKTSIEDTLAPGTYYWRVRGYGTGYVPGAFSMSSMVIVERENEESGTERAGSNSQGPPIANVQIELIGATGIVTGKTLEGSIVRVNGSPAVMLESGNFRAVVTFLKEGEQTIEITSYDPSSGLQSAETRTVKVSY